MTLHIGVVNKVTMRRHLEQVFNSNICLVFSLARTRFTSSGVYFLKYVFGDKYSILYNVQYHPAARCHFVF